MDSIYNVHPIKAFSDNYLWALTHENSSECVIVDPGSYQEVLDFLTKNQLTLHAILVTHHHQDHIGGIAQLKKQFPNIDVYGPANEAKSVVTVPLKENDTVYIKSLALSLTVLDVPGHTLGHIAYVDEYSLFCGDTLFAAGCGRMFEGTPEMFEDSLSKFKSLAPQTNVYCAHEYTLSNLKFAKVVEPNSLDLMQRIKTCQQQRDNDQPTLPSTISQELTTNPFLRLTHPDVIKALNAKFNLTLTNNNAENFSWLRQWKDQF